MTATKLWPFVSSTRGGTRYPSQRLLPAAYADKFTGKYEHRTFTGGVGHNPPQEAPHQFVQAVIDASRM